MPIEVFRRRTFTGILIVNQEALAIIGASGDPSRAFEPSLKPVKGLQIFPNGLIELLVLGCGWNDIRTGDC